MTACITRINVQQISRIFIRALFLLVVTLPVTAPSLFAQSVSNFKTGKISASDFNISSSLINERTAAVIIADVGSASLENYQNYWTILVRRTKRIKILNQNGFDACTIKILYSAEENRNNKLKDLEASTYNLNGDKVEVIPLSSKDIFITRDKETDMIEEKFTFPAVKAGSIVEYNYTVRYSDIMDLYPWNFQGKYPTLWSEYAVTIPGFFNYTKIMQGQLPFYETSIDSSNHTIWVGNGNMNTDIYTLKWVMKDAPEIKTEPLVYCPDNYVSKMHFQIARSPVSSYGSRTRFRSWQYLANALLDGPFGDAAVGGKSWLKDSVKNITRNCATELDKARKIFAFTRDNYQRVISSAYPYLDPKETFVSRQGSTADINLMLTAMLRTAGIEAQPVILSTRQSGKIIQDYPVLENIDYTIARVQIDDREYFLDASEKKIGFNKLPLKCFNGLAQVIGPVCFPAELNPDNLRETKITVISVTQNDNAGMQLRANHYPGYFESLGIRQNLQNGKPVDYLSALSKSFISPLKLEASVVDSLESYEKPVHVQYDFSFKTGDEERLYFNPVINKSIAENPFTAATRTYPIELPYLFNQVYEMNMEIPKGYELEELPAAAKIYLNENDGSFEYDIVRTGDSIKIECKLLTYKTYFNPEEYKALSDFYAFVIKKESEMIVFKKLK